MGAYRPLVDRIPAYTGQGNVYSSMDWEGGCVSQHILPRRVVSPGEGCLCLGGVSAGGVCRGGVCPGPCLPSGGVCPGRCVCPGSLCLEVFAKGGFSPGGVCLGVSTQGVSTRGCDTPLGRHSPRDHRQTPTWDQRQTPPRTRGRHPPEPAADTPQTQRQTPHWDQR